MELKKLELLCQHNLHIKSRPLLFTPRFNNIKCTKFLFFMYCNVKEKGQITRNKNSKKKNVYIENQYYYYFGLPKLGSVWPVQQKLKLPLP